MKNIALDPAVDATLDMLKRGTNRKFKTIGRNIYIESCESIENFNILANINTDMTEAFTYISAAFITRGELCIKDVNFYDNTLYSLLKKMKVRFEIDEKSNLKITGDKLFHIKKIECTPYPGIPSDIGPILSAALLKTEGYTEIIDYVYPTRSTHTKDLELMGYRIKGYNNKVTVKGSKPNNILCNVYCSDIRAGAALLIGALGRNTTTILNNHQQILRGYYNIVDNLKSLGADITTGEE